MESVEQVEFLIEAGPVLTRWKHDAFDRDRNRRRFAATELPIAEVDVMDDLVDCLERPGREARSVRAAARRATSR
jgi:hypothetical protein